MSSKQTNLFLDSLSTESRNSLVRLCVEMDLPLRKSLYEPGDTPAYAYFITSGIASVVAMMENGGMAEVGLIGREGVVGSFHLLGPAKVSTSCFIQLEATALRIRFTDLMNVFRTNEEIRDRVLEFVQEQAVSLSQLAGCNRLHENEERLARWLLMAQDRTQTDTLNFTQEFLGLMLGARRTTVTLIAGILQRGGLIKYQRGGCESWIARISKRPRAIATRLQRSFTQACTAMLCRMRPNLKMGWEEGRVRSLAAWRGRRGRFPEPRTLPRM
jgi:CRP-like cAMP-binding protein